MGTTIFNLCFILRSKGQDMEQCQAEDDQPQQHMQEVKASKDPVQGEESVVLESQPER